MEPLITIETVPITIEYVEKKPACDPAGQVAELCVARNENRITIESRPITVQLQDRFVSSPGSNWNHPTYSASARFSDNGNLRMDIRMDEMRANDFLFRQFGRGIENIMDFLPKPSGDVQKTQERMQISFDLSRLPGGLPAADGIDTSFLPPDLEVKVVERPRVIIKYVGDPIYIPKSSDPDYVPPEESSQGKSPEPILDVKA